MSNIDFILELLKDKFNDPLAALDTLTKYLAWRKSAFVKGDGSFGVVFVTSRYCNLACKHCAVDAKFRYSSLSPTDTPLSTDRVLSMFRNLRDYAARTNQKIFFMFGGGEPTLREDFPILLKEASANFGPENVGFCTNGTFLPPDDVLNLADSVGLLEISLDGFADYHNQWRPPTSHVSDPYTETLTLIKKAIAKFPNKVEVASIVTKHNIDQLPELARFLRDEGLQHYSVHRPVPIGRMYHFRHIIPDIGGFLEFMIRMAEVAMENRSLSLHLHHSLESIYSVLLLNGDIHLSSQSLGSKRHSIGVDSDGSIHFDPWAILPPFSMLSPGTLANENTRLEDLLDEPNSILNLILESKKMNVRCHQCSEQCSGGMRLAAIIKSIGNDQLPSMVMPGILLAAVSELDPACPLSKVRG